MAERGRFHEVTVGLSGGVSQEGGRVIVVEPNRKVPGSVSVGQQALSPSK